MCGCHAHEPRKTVKCRGDESLKGMTDEDNCEALDEVLRVYNAAGFRVKTIECDGACKSMVHEVQDSLGVQMNHCDPDEHLPPVERSVQVIKNDAGCIAIVCLIK